MAGCEFNVSLEPGAFAAHQLELSQQHPDWTPEALHKQALIDFNIQMFPAQVKSWLAERRGEAVMQPEFRYLEVKGRLASEFYGPFQRMIDAASSDEEREILTAFELAAVAAKPGEEIRVLDASALGRGGGVKYFDVFAKEVDGSVKHRARIDLTGDGPDLSLAEARLKLEQLEQEALKEKITAAAAEAVMPPAVLPAMPEPEQQLEKPVMTAEPETLPVFWSIRDVLPKTATATPVVSTATIIIRSIEVKGNFSELRKTDSDMGGQDRPAEAENDQVLGDEIKIKPLQAEPKIAATIRRLIGVSKKEASYPGKDNQISNQNSDQGQKPGREEKVSKQIEKSPASRLKAEPEVKPEIKVEAKPADRVKESRPKFRPESQTKLQPRPTAGEKHEKQHESKTVFFSRKPKAPPEVEAEQLNESRKPVKPLIPEWQVTTEPLNDKEIPVWQPTVVFNFNATILLLAMFWLILNTKPIRLPLVRGSGKSQIGRS
jgi:hypothetical protein